MSTYAVVIEDAGLNYSASGPDLPGCDAVGATLDDVTTNVYDAIEHYIAASIEFGDEVSSPSSHVTSIEVAT